MQQAGREAARCNEHDACAAAALSGETPRASQTRLPPGHTRKVLFSSACVPAWAGATGRGREEGGCRGGEERAKEQGRKSKGARKEQRSKLGRRAGMHAQSCPQFGRAAAPFQ